MWRTILKSIWSRKRRLAATSTAVLLGVAFLTASLATGDTLTNGFDQLFTNSNAGTDVYVRSATSIDNEDGAVRGRIDASMIDTIRDVDGVGEVIPVVEGTAQLVGADGVPLGGNGPPTLATNWLGTSPLNPWSIDTGRPPSDVPAGQPLEVVIDRSAADLGSLVLGDVTTIRTPTPIDVVVVGITTIAGEDSLGPLTYAGFADATVGDLVGRDGEVSAFRIAAEPGVDAETLRTRIADAMPSTAETLTGQQLTADMVAGIESEFLGFFKAILLAFAGIALVVAAFSIHNTFTIVVAQRSRESALLRTIGASRRQILSSVIAEALVVGVLASAAGLAVGYGLAVGLNSLMASLGLDLGTDGISMSTATITIAAAVGVLATFAASVVPAVRASRVAPLESLRTTNADESSTSKWRIVVGAIVAAAGVAVLVTAPSADPALTRAAIGAVALLIGAVALGPLVAVPGARFIGTAPAIIRGQNGRLARRNAMRDPRRTAATASALMIGTAVAALFTTFGASIEETISNVVNQDFGGDLVVVTDDFGGAGVPPALADEIAGLDEVTTAAGLGEAVALIDGAPSEPAVADGPRLGAVLDLGVVEGHLDDLVAGNVAVSSDYAVANGLALGESIDMSFADGASTTLQIASVYENRVNVGDVVMTPADWEPHADQLGWQAILIDLAPGVSESAGVEAVTAVTERFAAPDVQTRSEYIDSIAAEVDSILFFVYGMLAIAVLIALMGIANTLSLSIHERTRELGVLRSIGQTRAGVRSTVRWESVIIALLGTLAGVGLGTFLGWALLRALAADQGYGDIAIPIVPLLMIVGLAALAGVASAWRPARRAARLDILTAIATD